MNTPPTVLVVGGTSDIGLAVARCYAAHGWRVVLAARETSKAERNVLDLAARFGGRVSSVMFDVCELDAHGQFVDSLDPLPDTVVCVVGLLGDQERAQTDPDHAALILRSNFEGPALVLGEIANRMALRGSGTIVGVGSVAGDRGRGSNYVYGSAKAGLAAFLSGLRNRMASKGVHVLTVKPGFVDTAMTRHLDLPKAVTASPAEVGKAIYRAAERTRRNVIYVRPVWWAIMLIIKAIPEALFKRLGL